MTESEGRAGAGWRRQVVAAITRITGPALILLSLATLIMMISATDPDSGGDADHLLAFPAALAIAGLLVCTIFLPAGAYRRVLVGLGTGLAAATGVAFAVGYGMYVDAECYGGGIYKNVDCFVDTERTGLFRNISLAATPVFVLFFPLGYWAAGQVGNARQEDA